jgi:DNA-directed RNA polymerase subunit RPC12/RpoP
MYKAQTTHHGAVNNIKVKCTKCGTNLLICPPNVRAAGGWECPACGKKH